METQHDNGLSNRFKVMYGIVSIVANISSRSRHGFVNKRMERAQNRQTGRAYDMTAQTPQMERHHSSFSCYYLISDNDKKKMLIAPLM